MKKPKSLLLSAAVAGLLLGTASLTSCTKQAENGKQTTNQVAVDKHACKALNTCKNKGGCKTGDNGCAQKNSCNGKGGCKLPKTCKGGVTGLPAWLGICQ